MGQSILLTLGRLPKGLELARALHGAGHRVLVADPFGWHLSKPSRAVARSFTVPAPARDQAGYLNALIDIVCDEGVDLVIPVSEEVMHVSLLAGRLPETTTLFCPPHETLRTLHDKYGFIGHVDGLGLAAPTTYLGDDPAAAVLAAEAATIVKARFGCSGTGLHFLERGAALPEALQNADWVVQRRITGQEMSTLSLCRDGAIIGHVVYRGLVMSGTVAVCFERVIESGPIDEWVRRFAASTRHSGFVAFDFMVDADGAPWPLECNPRLTSGVHFMDPVDLAAAVTGSGPGDVVDLRPGLRFQEGHTALTMAYANILKPQKFWRMLKAIGSSRDVLWSSSDPLVFPLMTPMSWPVLRQVMLEGRSFGEAATLDIEWLPDQPDQGGEPARSASAAREAYEAQAS